MRSRVAVRWLAIVPVMLAAGVAAAQTTVSAPAVRNTVDANGVDLVGGGYITSATDVSIGPSGPHGLAFTRSWSTNGWADTASGGISGSTSKPVVTVGGSSDSFTLSNGTYVPDQGNGATLTTSGSGNYTYVNSVGTVVTFIATGNYTHNGAYANLAEISSITFGEIGRAHV